MRFVLIEIQTFRRPIELLGYSVRMESFTNPVSARAANAAICWELSRRNLLNAIAQRADLRL